ncbi:MAG TPA: peroxiredoxin family protein [Longimicrobiales bacterium]|nr:peroxiredoxin family protein [Longimicrobiales bacterium]
MKGRVSAVGVLVMLALAGEAAAQDGQFGPADGTDLPATDIERVAVGSTAPDFTLAKFGGGTVTLSQFRGEKNVVLVFYRGYWCPYCIRQLSDHAVIARYGILNPDGSRRGIPQPATYVIDRAGIVRWRDVQTDYTVRPTNEAILSALEAIRSGS